MFGNKEAFEQQWSDGEESSEDYNREQTYDPKQHGNSGEESSEQEDYNRERTYETKKSGNEPACDNSDAEEIEMEMKPADVEMQSVEQDAQRVQVDEKPY